MANTNIFITYDELSKLQKDSADKASIIAILNTEFPDDTCQLIAVKSILGMIKNEEEETPEVPSDDTPTTDPAEGDEGDGTPATEPTDPAEGEGNG